MGFLRKNLHCAMNHRKIVAYHLPMTTFKTMNNPSHTDIKQLGDEVRAASEPFTRLQEAMHAVIVGQDQLLHRMFIGLLANGHLLIEGVPGLAKTLGCL